MLICLSSSVDTTIYCRHYSTGLWAMASLSAQSCSPFPVFFSLRSQAGIKISPAHTHWYTHTHTLIHAHTHWYTHTHDGRGSEGVAAFLGVKTRSFFTKRWLRRKFISVISSPFRFYSLSLSLSRTWTHTHSFLVWTSLSHFLSLFSPVPHALTHARTHLASSRNLVMSSTSSHF